MWSAKIKPDGAWKGLYVAWQSGAILEEGNATYDEGDGVDWVRQLAHPGRYGLSALKNPPEDEYGTTSTAFVDQDGIIYNLVFIDIP